MKRVGLVRDDIFLKHITSDHHPEHPDRLRAIHAMLDREDMQGRFPVMDRREATQEEILQVHGEGYFRRVEATSGRHGMLDPDTHVSSETYRVAKIASGGLLRLIDQLFAGELSSGFALVRPPGHHAEADRGMGFCIYNNIAIGACYARRKGLAGKVLIVDWDLHHGNGTQHSFQGDDTILYFSTHQYPYYPGTGGLEEVGVGAGKGCTVNVPLPGGQGDGDYLYIFKKVLAPVARGFQPDLILVSAGFDIFAKDPLGSMRVTEEGFGNLARSLRKSAEEVCNGRILFTLEGGYHVAGQAGGVKHVLGALEEADPAPIPDTEASDTTARIVQNVRKVHGSKWDL